jgi:L-seryl-tRNA(Ser) seleniumtransferase
MSNSWNHSSRRSFLHWAGIASLIGSIPSARLMACRRPDHLDWPVPYLKNSIYAELGTRPFINAAGTYTALSASLMPAEVVAAMGQASQSYVEIPELQETAGKRIASLIGCEAALVTSGCAQSLTLATAACVCGTDSEKIHRVPDTSGMKNEVIFQRSHRFSYDHAVRNLGVKIVEVETRQELEASINEKTALLFFLNLADPKGQIKRQEFAEIANKRGIPCLIDAAADLPPAENLSRFTKMGYDLAAFSGGKGLRGPQCSGLLLGRKELIQAAFVNGSPHSDSVGRGGKVGKEEIVGLMKAVELYVNSDHEKEWQEWEHRVSVVEEAVQTIRGVHTERFIPVIANQVPHLAILWDPAFISLTTDLFVEALRDGEPRIEVRSRFAEKSPIPRLEIAVWMLQPREAEIVGSRCAVILKSHSARVGQLVDRNQTT